MLSDTTTPFCSSSGCSFSGSCSISPRIYNNIERCPSNHMGFSESSSLAMNIFCISNFTDSTPHLMFIVPSCHPCPYSTHAQIVCHSAWEYSWLHFVSFRHYSRFFFFPSLILGGKVGRRTSQSDKTSSTEEQGSGDDVQTAENDSVTSRAPSDTASKATDDVSGKRASMSNVSQERRVSSLSVSGYLNNDQG